VNNIKADITIIGAGVTGLLATKKLTDLGYDVVLIEKEKVVASGPSTRNEGWLHRGTYHAASIKNEEEALEVARTCIYGHDQIRRYAPEAVDDLGQPTYAIIGSDELADHSVSRWNKAGAVHKQISLNNFASLNPEVDIQNIKHVFEVGDIGFNPRIFYQKLLTQSEKKGAKIFLQSRLLPKQNGYAKILREGNEPITLSTDMVIVTAGNGIKDFFREVSGEDLPIRFWKSHLLVFPRLAKYNTFYIDRGEAMIFSHGNTSVIGQHHEDFIVESPDYTAIPDKVELVFRAANRLIPKTKEYKDSFVPVTCMKPDLVRGLDQPRGYDVNIIRADDKYLFVFPGKMTAAPFIADKLVQMVFNGDSEKFARIAPRPCDIYKIDQDDKLP
jgi:glycerol-3-phosphate dehydrogenase